MPLYGQRGYGSGRYGIADAGPIYKQPLGYYLNLFTSQYKGSAYRFINGWAQKAWTPLDDLTNCLSFLSGQYDLDVAQGVQLDDLGQLIGQSRTVGFQPTGSVSPTLDDDTYRILLKARVAINSWDGRLVSLYGIWKGLFPGGSLVINDNQNMTATIIVSGTFTSIIVDLITNGYIVPRPEGVEYTYATSDLPIFGTDLDNAFVAGVDLGHIS
jgi:Protein of unknown function (DUF2612)